MSEEDTGAQTEGQGQAETEQSTPSYYLSEDIAGKGDAPEWFKGDKYKTVADQAKGYSNLEKMHGELTNKFGSFVGAPEQYQVNAPEGIELANDDPMLTSAIEWGKENNLSQGGMDSLLGLYATMEALREQAAEDYFKEQTSQIEGFEARENNINDFLKANELDSLAGQITTKESLEQFEKLLDMAGSPKLDPMSESNSIPSDEEIDRLMFETDDHGRRIYLDSAERQSHVKRLLQAKVGRGQYNKAVG